MSRKNPSSSGMPPEVGASDMDISGASGLAGRLVSRFPGMAYQASPDVNRTLLRASTGASLITGLSPEELGVAAPKDLRSFVHPDDRTAVDVAVRTAVQEGGPFNERYRMVGMSGRPLWVWDRASVSPDEAGNSPCFEGWITDVTEMVHLEERAITSQRREALGELVGAVAGEFNNALAVIVGGVDLALEHLELAPDDPAAAALEDARTSALRGGGLTRKLLAFARRQPALPKATDLNTLVHRTQQVLNPLLGRGYDLIFALASDLPSLRVDPAQIEQVVLNLVLNARDAMPDGGAISVRTERAVLTEGDLRKDDEMSPGPYVILQVSDKGSGIEPTVRSRMFEPFVTTKERHTGLGLATAFGIVRQAGGMIRVRSSAERGTTFSVYLPSSEEAVERPTREPLPSAAHAEETEAPLILVVDDDDVVRRTMVRTLERHGFRTLQGSDAESALVALNKSPEPVRLLLTDIMMPGPNGPELADRVHDVVPGVPVVFTSGNVEEDELDALRLGPGRRFIAKPFTLVELVGLVRTALSDPSRSTADDGGAPADPSQTGRRASQPGGA